MTTYRITKSSSAQTAGDFIDAFNKGSNGDDKLVVDAGAFLIATGNGAHAARIAVPGTWTVDINGTLASAQGNGLYMFGGAAPSTITVGRDGQVVGLYSGMTLNGAAILNNKGVITSGDLHSGLFLQSIDAHTITNSGTISGRWSIQSEAASRDTIFNSGVLNGHVDTAGGGDTVTNGGTINGAVILGEQGDRLTNSGIIEKGVTLEEGNDRLINSGIIRHDIEAGDGNDTIRNSGNIGSWVRLQYGNDTFINFEVVNGVLKNGFVLGEIDLGEGADHFEGGAKAEFVSNGGDDLDEIWLNGGNDTYYALKSGGNDKRDAIDGGSGIDAYDGSESDTGLLINLDRVAHADPDLGAAPVGASRAVGSFVAGNSHDRILNFENAFGGGAADTIYGSGAANRIEGAGGADRLFGFGGNDRLIGGLNDDVLVGGTGRDTLTGASGADTFVYFGLADSGPSASKRDLIVDFQQGQDLIDLSRIDANTATKVNDAFAFIGTNVEFGGQAGELRSVWSATGVIIEADVNGDKLADFSIAVNNPGYGTVFTGSDFVL